MIDLKKIYIRMINIKRRHKIAAVVILLVLGVMLVLNSVLAQKPIPAVSAVKKSVKTGKSVVKKTKIADNNQVPDSNLTANTAKKSVKTVKSAVKKTKIADNNQVSNSNLTVLPAKGSVPAVLIDANGNVFVDVNGLADKTNKAADNNEAFDPNRIIIEPNKPADSNMPVDANAVEDGNKLMAAVLPQVKSQPAELSANLSTIQSGIQSLLFIRNMPRIDALQLLAGRYNKNIIPTSKVSGTLNFTKLNNVSFEEAMNAILGSEFQYQQQGNLIRVYATGEFQSSEMVCKVFTLYYITAAEAKKMITPVMSREGKMEITTAAETGVPVDATITAPKGGGDTVAINDMIVIYDYPDRIAKAEQIIAAIDIRPKQILIEATIMTATLTNDTQLGIDWRNLEGAAVTSLTGLNEDSPDFFGFGGTATKIGAVSPTGGITIGVVRNEVAAFIKAVEAVTDVTILANPKILATNKQLGQVYIGTKVAYLSQTTQTDTSTTQAVAFLDTGTKLSFRPYIGDDGYIRMDIHPKDSSATIRTVGPATSTVALPDETSAELVTNIIVKDGETIVIGGLFRNKVQTAKTQIPILGNIPIIGLAFGSHADEVEREEVIVLLTPHIIAEPNQAEGAERAQDVARKSMGAEKELSPSRMRLAQLNYEKAAVYYVRGRNREALKELDSALELYPGYLEAIQLEEKIYSETDPKKKPVRKVIDQVEKPKSDKWRRR
jgi:type IV pilus assembly protein PilQ